MTPDFRFKNVTLRPMAFLKTLHFLRTQPALYVNNPKVACSTIKLALQRAETGDPDYQPVKSVHNHRGSPLLTWPTLKIRDLRPLLQDHFTFSFVRCPYARLQSAYANKIVPPQKKGRFRIDAGFQADEVPSFEDFIRSITAQIPKQQNPHWRPQSVNLSIDAISFDYIGRLEQFATDWKPVSDRLTLSAVPQRAGKKSDRSLAVYSEEAAELTRKYYARDFEAFDYSADPSAYLANA